MFIRYQVLLDGKNLFFPGDEEYLISDSVINLQLNDSGTFECDVPVSNPEYENIHPRSSMIQVLKEDKELFYGEVRESEKDFNGTKHIYAVGELAFLFDSIQPQAEYHELSPRQLLDKMITQHNSQVEEKKRFYTGIVTVHDANDSLYRYTNRETTLDAIRDKLVDRLGGYLRVRKADGKRYLDYVELADYGKICEQPIMFGENLLDYSENTSANDLYSAVIPLGARIEEETVDPDQPAALEKYVDITSVNGGKDYLFSQAAINQYGWCKNVVTWDDVHVPAILKTKGEQWLADNQFEQMTLELTAVDLSVLDQEYDSFELGDSIHALAEPYGMDRYFPVQKLEIHLQDPEENKLVLGDTVSKSYTSQSSQNNKQISNEVEKNQITSNFLKSAIDNATQMMTGSKGGYKVTELDDSGRWLRDLYMNAPDKANATRIMQINMNGIGFSRDGFNGPYKNAWTIDGVLLGEFIKAGTVQAEALSTEYKSSVQKSIIDSADDTKRWATSEITTAIKASEDRISLSVTEQRKYIDGVKESLSGELKVTSEAITAEATRATEAEGKLQGKLTVASDNITAEVTRAKDAESKLSASIKVTADSIVNKVSAGDFASYLEQYYDRVLFKFNSNSKYVQINAGEIGIYDGALTENKKRSVFDQNGSHFYRDGYYVGKTGTNQWVNNSAHKGLTFDLEYQGKYMAFSQKASAASSEYNAMLCFSRANSIYNEYGVHLGCDLYGEWFTLNKFNIGNISAGGYTGFTGAIPIVTSISDNGNGTISWQYSKLRVYSGITAGYWL